MGNIHGEKIAFCEKRHSGISRDYDVSSSPKIRPRPARARSIYRRCKRFAKLHPQVSIRTNEAAARLKSRWLRRGSLFFDWADLRRGHEIAPIGCFPGNPPTTNHRQHPPTPHGITVPPSGASLEFRTPLPIERFCEWASSAFSKFPRNPNLREIGPRRRFVGSMVEIAPNLEHRVRT